VHICIAQNVFRCAAPNKKTTEPVTNWACNHSANVAVDSKSMSSREQQRRHCSVFQSDGFIVEHHHYRVADIAHRRKSIRRALYVAGGWNNIVRVLWFSRDQAGLLLSRSHRSYIASEWFTHRSNIRPRSVDGALGFWSEQNVRRVERICQVPRTCLLSCTCTSELENSEEKYVLCGFGVRFSNERSKRSDAA